MATLLQLEFDASGLTEAASVNFTNLGGISYEVNSHLGDQSRKCAYFLPFRDDSGFKINNGKDIADLIKNPEKYFCIYFWYKIDKSEQFEKEIPIISYLDSYTHEDECDQYGIPYHNTEPMNYLLYIQEKRFFTFNLYATDHHLVAYYSRDIEYTLDGNWHLFVLTRNDNLYRFYIDGILNSIYEYIPDYDPPIQCGEQMYLGWHKDINTNYITNLNNAFIDDLFIMDTVPYRSSFLPPNNFFTGRDVSRNYKNRLIYDLDLIEPEIQDRIEHVKENGTYYHNESQIGWLPRRLKLKWWQDHDYFQDTIHHTITFNDDMIAIKIQSNDGFTFMSEMITYYENTFKYALEHHDIYPVMIFVNGYYVKLSKCWLMKSDDWVTILIEDKNIKTKKRVKTFDIVLIPLQIIYEEEQDEKSEYRILFSFNDKGEFTQSGATTFYYLEKGLLDDYEFKIIEDWVDKDEDTINPHHMDKLGKWRYGNLVSVEKQTRNNKRGGLVKYRSFDADVAYPGDEVVLYKKTFPIKDSKWPVEYHLVGPDLFYFDDWDPSFMIHDDQVCSMYLYRVKPSRKDWSYVNFTDKEIVTLKATLYMQSVFDIPEIYDEKNNRYMKFLVFRNNLLLVEGKDYTTDLSHNYIRLLDSDKFLPIGEEITFVMVKNFINAGKYIHHFHPIYIKLDVDETDMSSELKYFELEFTKDNFLLFADGSRINENKYTVIKNKLSYDSSISNTILNADNIFIVLLKVSNYIFDPLTLREEFISNVTKYGEQFVLYDLNIDKNYKITLDNFVCFDNKGRYIYDLYGSVYSTNIIKSLFVTDKLNRSIRYIVAIWNKKHSLKNVSNALIPTNDHFIKTYIRMYKEFYELDEVFDEFINDFSIEYKYTDNYSTNMVKALDNIVTYNQTLLTPVYENNATITRRTYINDHINSLAVLKDGRYRFKFPRNSKYIGNHYRTYLIFFLNGKLADFNKDLEYIEDYVIISSDSERLLNDNDILESIEFHNMQNFLLNSNLKGNKVDTEDDFNETFNSYGVKSLYEVYRMKDLQVFARVTDYSYYPVEFVLDIHNDIRISNKKFNYYFDKLIFIGSKRQFLYKRYILEEDTNEILLDEDMKTAWDEKRFLIFRNGLLMNNNLFIFIIPKPDNVYKYKKILCRSDLFKDDIIDVYYIESEDYFSKIPINKDIYLGSIKYLAERDEQTVIQIPYPNKYMRKDKYGFFIFNEKGEYLDNRYDYTTSIDGLYITLADYNRLPRRDENYVVFVFPYLQSDIELNDFDPIRNGIRSSVELVYQYSIFDSKTYSNTGGIVKFRMDNGEVFSDYTIKKENFMIYGNTTFISPERYELIDNGTIRFIDSVDIEHSPYTRYTMIIMTETDKQNDHYEQPRMIVVSEKVIYDRQKIFNIPIIDGEYLSFIVIIGSIVMERYKHFNINDTNHTIVMTDYFDYVQEGRDVYFIFLLSKVNRFNRATKFEIEQFRTIEGEIEDTQPRVLNRFVREYDNIRPVEDRAFRIATNQKWEYIINAIDDFIQDITDANLQDDEEIMDYLMNRCEIWLRGNLGPFYANNYDVNREIERELKFAINRLKEFEHEIKVPFWLKAAANMLELESIDIESYRNKFIYFIQNPIILRAHLFGTGTNISDDNNAACYLFLRYICKQGADYGRDNWYSVTKIPHRIFRNRKKFGKNNMLLFMNGIYLRPQRFIIFDNYIYIKKDLRLAGYNANLMHHTFTLVYLKDYPNKEVKNRIPARYSDMKEERDSLEFDERYAYPYIDESLGGD